MNESVARNEERVPSLEECIRLMDKYGMLDNIRRHSLVVAQVAAQLHAALAVAGRVQDALPLVVAGALLHDIAKTQCLYGKCHHAEVGAEICQTEGFPEIAWIVGQHVRLDPFDAAAYEEGCFGARELVHYADKRVRHHEVVSLNERLEYVLTRYGKRDVARCAVINRYFQDCQRLEQLLFRWLPFPPEDLGLAEPRGFAGHP